MVKGDKSSKVGGRRKKGPAAPKRSVNKGARGRPVVYPGGNDAYQKRGK